MKLRRSELITRRELAGLSGGGGGSTKNPLELLTPISYTGGAAIATKQGVVSHIVIKENSNEELPTMNQPQEVLYNLRRYGSKPTRDIQLLARQSEDNTKKTAIPLFWEPTDQPNSATKVQYVGHWTVKKVEINSFIFKNIDRCGTITLKLHHYSDKFDEIIKEANRANSSSHKVVGEEEEAVESQAVESEAAVKSEEQETEMGEAKRPTAAIKRKSGHTKRGAPSTKKVKKEESEVIEILDDDGDNRDGTAAASVEAQLELLRNERDAARRATDAAIRARDAAMRERDAAVAETQNLKQAIRALAQD